MHYHCEVWIPYYYGDDHEEFDNDVEEQVLEIMIPFQEKEKEDGSHNGGIWDWYEIGGRFSGIHGENVIPVSQIPEDFSSYTLIFNGQVFICEKYDPSTNKIIPKDDIRSKFRALKHLNGFLVTVDYHN